MHRNRALPCLALLSLAPRAAAQTITPLVVEGDSIPGVGLVTEIQNLALNSAGDWYVEVETDNSDADRDEALIKSGVLYLREGDALAMPPGAALDAFDAVSMDSGSHAAFDWTLSGTGGTGDNGGIYFDTSLVLQKGAISSAPGFGPGTVYGTFSNCLLNDAGQILAVGLVDDPNVPGTSDWAAVVLSTDGMGNLTGESRVAGEGDLLPGQTLLVNTIRSGAHASAINLLGQVIFAADLDTSSTGDDAVVYLDSTLIAQEGSPAPVAGRTWGDLLSPEVDLNTAGQWTIKDTLDNSDTSTDGIIVLTGAKFRQEGDSLPAIAPYTFTYFGNGPAALTETGQVLWFGRWNDPDTGVDEGLFLDDVLLVQQGVTQIAGQTVIDVGDQTENYAISADGRFVLFEATLSGGGEGAFLLDLAPSGAVVTAGADLLRTPGDSCSYQGFSATPLPAGFFGPGSLPFDGDVFLRGLPLSGTGLVGGADTIIQRLSAAQLPNCGSSDAVPVEIVALSLESLAPIRVDFGSSTSQYRVQVCLSSFAQQSTGSMTITQTHAGGGEYSSMLPVVPRLVFTKVSGAAGLASAVIDPAPQLVFNVPALVSPEPGAWAFDGSVLGVPASPGGTVDHDCDPNTPAVPFPASSNFTRGIDFVGASCGASGSAELSLQRGEDLFARHCALPVAPAPDDVPYCFCYPETAPCGNAFIAGGCGNSGAQGGLLVKSGNASIAADTLALTATGVTNQPGVFFQGVNSILSPFGDGNRCAGGALVRLILVLGVNQCASTDLSCGMQVGGIGGPISQHPGNAGLMAGDTRYYQFWYRDPGGPCGVGFNLTSAHSVLWGI